MLPADASEQRSLGTALLGSRDVGDRAHRHHRHPVVSVNLTDAKNAVDGVRSGLGRPQRYLISSDMDGEFGPIPAFQVAIRARLRTGKVFERYLVVGPPAVCDNE